MNLVKLIELQRVIDSFIEGAEEDYPELPDSALCSDGNVIYLRHYRGHRITNGALMDAVMSIIEDDSHDILRRAQESIQKELDQEMLEIRKTALEFAAGIDDKHTDETWDKIKWVLKREMPEPEDGDENGPPEWQETPVPYKHPQQVQDEEMHGPCSKYDEEEG